VRVPSTDEPGRDRLGLALSAALHAVALALLLLLVRTARHDDARPPPFVPVAIVARNGGDGPGTEAARAAGPLAPARSVPSAPHPAHRVMPRHAARTADPLETQLQALSRLRLPQSGTAPGGQAGAGPDDGTSDSPGGQGIHATRDIIRAQIIRRWNLDMGRLGDRRFTVALHIVLKPDGTVLDAQVVDRARYGRDAVFRWIALSARNAVILASPLTLPAGPAGERLDLVVTLDPRDALQ
jgi:hypothetical protein